MLHGDESSDPEFESTVFEPTEPGPTEPELARPESPEPELAGPGSDEPPGLFRRLASLRRGIRLYLRFLAVHLRASLEYEADFWMMIVAAALYQGLTVVFIGAVFARVPDLNGWTMPEVVLITSMVVLAEGIGSLLHEGIWRLPWRANQGELDYLLVRPYPVLLQITSCNIGLNGLGNLLTGGLMFGWAVTNMELSATSALLLVPLVISGFLVKAAIIVSATFLTLAASWMSGSTVNLAFSLHKVGDLARYPLTIYPGPLKLFFTVLLPFGFVSFYPVAAVVRPESYLWATVVTPFVAGACVLVALRVVRVGLRRYESVGS